MPDGLQRLCYRVPPHPGPLSQGENSPIEARILTPRTDSLTTDSADFADREGSYPRDPCYPRLSQVYGEGTDHPDRGSTCAARPHEILRSRLPLPKSLSEKWVERATSQATSLCLAATCRQKARRAGSPPQQAGGLFHPEDNFQAGSKGHKGEGRSEWKSGSPTTRLLVIGIWAEPALLGVWLYLIGLTAVAASQASRPLSPSDELATLCLADANLTVELVAAEPNVISPVAIAWDADGRLFVAEMIDYPLGPGTGQIRRLEDLDGDGQYEKATVFADRLSFPNGVLPWKDGLLVTSAPNIWFLKDTNGDGKADERRVILTGFREGNQQLRVNGLTWGIDNWIYAANGRSDGDIRRPDEPAAKGVSLRNHDLRFRPDTGEFEVIAGRSQFGRARDDWGNHFLSWNTIPVRHVVIEERYLNRNPQLRPDEGVLDILAPADTGRVFPLTPPPLVFNKESSSHFNALAGLTIYRGDALGEKYCGNAFMGESLRNLVHRRVLEPNGVTFVARRGEEGKEFLASSDPWFHAVNFATGPDGALYVVDFYRQFVEHPEYVHNPSVEKRIPWRTGAEHGRIWRIKRKATQTSGGKAAATKSDRLEACPTLSGASTAELVQWLGHPNGWWRDTAQRLLVERQDRAAISLLKSAIRNPQSAIRNPQSAIPLARLHATWTLDGLGALDERTVLSALRDKDPRIREHAVRLSERFLGNSPNAAQLKRGVTRLAGDADARVRLELALAAGGLAAAERENLLAQLARRGVADRWQTLAILSSLNSRPWGFFARLVGANWTIGKRPWQTLPNDDTVYFVEKCARLIGSIPDGQDLERSLSWAMAAGSEATLPARLVFLAGMADGLEQRGHSLRDWIERRRQTARTPADSPQAFLERALRLVRSESERRRLRLAGIRVLVESRAPEAGAVALDWLRPGQASELQSAAIHALVKVADTDLAVRIFANWAEYAQGTRRQLANVASRSPALTVALLDALEQNRIPSIEMDASARQSLQKVPDAEARMRATKLFRSTVAADREEVLRKFKPALTLDREAGRGAEVFAKTCFVCHTIQGRGKQIGPDLSGIASRPPETVLIDILDPSRQVTPDFLSYTVTTSRGESVTGLLVAETSASVTLRRQSLPDETIPRSQIQELRADGKSLMPDGLEQGLSMQDIADLLAFLAQPDGSLLPKE
ncbi:MAG: c-type cytochrome [Verrucomicrobia bacterium]|nr:c-type cytochrome [Verrucomicrobiota bacterium]